MQTKPSPINNKISRVKRTKCECESESMTAVNVASTLSLSCVLSQDQQNKEEETRRRSGMVELIFFFPRLVKDRWNHTLWHFYCRWRETNISASRLTQDTVGCLCPCGIRITVMSAVYSCENTSLVMKTLPEATGSIKTIVLACAVCKRARLCVCICLGGFCRHNTIGGWVERKAEDTDDVARRRVQR